MSAILWRAINQVSLERCTLHRVTAGHRLAGTTLLAVDGVSYDLRYTVIADSEWRPTTVGVNVQGPDNDRTLALSADGNGNWAVADAPVIELHGASAVHFGWSPATHTLTLRHLDLAVGESGSVTAVRIGFPDRDIGRAVHTYERLAERRYRFTAGDFSTDLTVNADLLVTAYPGRWTTEAEA